MAGKPANKKFVAKKDEKAESEQLIQSAINGSYSLIIPIQDCVGLYVKNPVNGILKHFDVSTTMKIEKSGLVDYLKNLSDMGLGDKLVKDFNNLSKNTDPAWGLLLQILIQKGCFSGESVQAVA